MNDGRRWRAEAPYLLLLPVAAFIVILPLLLHGCSCGHDFEFHLQSWLAAAAQLRHGTLDPAWSVSSAWNAGEPRFLFYPPLSWMLGALLTLAMPLSAVPLVFTWLALASAGVTMYLLARVYVSPHAALIASALYLANPYMLFTAFERTAYGELLAAVWFPLLFLAALQTTPSLLRLAIPLSLLWLTNAPAAVIGVYTVVIIALARIMLSLRPSSIEHGSARTLFARFAAGGTLGLALPAFYLLPAAWERRYVQVAMAIIPNMRFQDNFLFGHTGDLPHDRVLHTASLLAIGLLAATALVLFLATLARRSSSRTSSTSPIPVLALLALLAAFLLTPLSSVLWQHTPELAFLQFPWRLLSLLGVILSLGVAFALHRSQNHAFRPSLVASAIALLLASCLTSWAIHEFRQPCEATDLPSTRAQLFDTHHGVEPTDEYTPTDADNDILRWDDPGYWLSPDSTAFAPGTIPNPAASIVNYDVPPPLNQTVSGIPAHHLVLQLAQPEALILNLRDYPAWQVKRNGVVLSHLQRDDGLLAVALPSGLSVIDIRWHRTWDQTLGDIVSLVALLVLAAILLRSRTIKT